MKNTRQCALENCERKHKGHGLCEPHLLRWRKLGKPSVYSLDVNIRPVNLDITTVEFIQLFWSRIKITTDKNQCWDWQLGLNGGGYGILTAGGQFYLAHRLAWQLSHHREPELNILHTCDRPPCCNPNHLYEGTHKQNAKDRDESSNGHHHYLLR